jgi:DNA-binding response OmpR family regulator
MDGQQLHALIVDDDDALCSVLSYRLKKDGYQVDCLPDGLEALDYLRDRRVDALLLDIMMTKVDGFQVLRAIGAGDVQRPLATVIMSARSAEEDMLKAFQLGAIDYVVKPFSINVLAARLRIALGLPAAARENRAAEDSAEQKAS